MPHDAGDYDVAGRRMLTVVDAVVGADVGKTMEERWRFLDDFVRQDNLSSCFKFSIASRLFKFCPDNNEI